MRMRSQVLRMRIISQASSNMRITLLPELRMRIVNLEEIFENLQKIGQKTEFISARPDHQNVKKNQKNFS